MTYFALKYLLCPAFFRSKTSQERYYAVIFINSNIHHVITTLFIVVTVLTQCDRPFGMFMFDSQCLRTYRPIYSHMIVFSFAYLSYDLFMQVFFYQDFSMLGQQNFVHHIVSFVCYAAALLGGSHMTLTTHLAMLCECSQIFLNVRNTIGKQAKGMFPLLNNLSFIGSYTLLRIILFPWLIVMHFKAA